MKKILKRTMYWILILLYACTSIIGIPVMGVNKWIDILEKFGKEVM